MTQEKQVLEYFKRKASGYDLVDQQVYWRLSDKLLWDTLDTKVLSKIPGHIHFLDAGGGTGRWSEKILRAYEHSNGVLYDLSPDMLKEAATKITGNLEGRLLQIRGDIQQMDVVPDNHFDLAFNFHNVLGFVASPEKALREITRTTKEGGYVVSVVPNQYHCAFFNISVGRIEEAERALQTGKGTFTSDMPAMHLFTPNSMHELYKNAGLETPVVFGFPLFIYPGMQETQIRGSSERLSAILDDPKNFDRIYSMERQYMGFTDMAARGNNLLVIGTKGRGGPQ